MFCFFLSGLFLLKGLMGWQLDISIAIAASILQCISCSLWNIFNAVRGTKEHCGWTVCCRDLSLQFISTCKFLKSNTFQSLWNEEILMCESPLSSSLTRNTKCKPRKIMSILTLDTRGKTWLREVTAFLYLKDIYIVWKKFPTIHCTYLFLVFILKYSTAILYTIA